HHLEFVLRGHGRLQHHAIKKQKSPTWRGFVSNLNPLKPAGFFSRGLPGRVAGRRRAPRANAPKTHRRCTEDAPIACPASPAEGRPAGRAR
ncbi:hypothetical protein, partial [Burkholderia mallei]|uniref:hypothetical protein n=1 Tax=Burkholderia mallei TaxID=13373 RepID=UPI001E509FE4